MAPKEVSSLSSGGFSHDLVQEVHLLRHAVEKLVGELAQQRSNQSSVLLALIIKEIADLSAKFDINQTALIAAAVKANQETEDTAVDEMIQAVKEETAKISMAAAMVPSLDK